MIYTISYKNKIILLQRKFALPDIINQHKGVQFVVINDHAPGSYVYTVWDFCTGKFQHG